ncbi:hypothetical protein ELE36_09340 [Pseudolysobacter antarcticus]|uniref:Uncharacterized protein n=1 Tax=Pseudolysobacter antarcticus TaxID=2511995 RepID=A0A411HJH8_9GAMM|nr:hypothetical protein [Pseudolysobacter antarcticus]QBB70550.1 hypothetical protein ELE36_09340 [Pseudolysobacter antarcticus]
MARLSALFSGSVIALQTSYLGNAQIDLTILLGPPPIAGSEADKLDLRTVLEAQQTRTRALVKRAQGDIEGGRIAGTVIAANMLQSPEFKTDFAKTKAELNQVAK